MKPVNLYISALGKSHSTSKVNFSGLETLVGYNFDKNHPKSHESRYCSLCYFFVKNGESQTKMTSPALMN
jgi:hypothetical protein